MTRNWEKEMQLDVELSESEKERFVKKIMAAGVPSIEEYAESIDKDRDEVEEEYMNQYGEAIRTARDAACEDAGFRSYEEDGKFFFEDEQETIQTSELIDTSKVTYSEYVLDYQVE